MDVLNINFVIKKRAIGALTINCQRLKINDLLPPYMWRNSRLEQKHADSRKAWYYVTTTL